VVSLVRGLLTTLTRRGHKVVCYALYDEPSWWRANVSHTVAVFRCVDVALGSYVRAVTNAVSHDVPAGHSRAGAPWRQCNASSTTTWTCSWT
jgi:hypothetical protein